MEPIGGRREGTVPARPRRVELAAPWLEGARPVCAVLASKSGKLSLPGDSGMISRRGVEWPLPAGGGPHSEGEMPSCAWISRALQQFQVRVYISFSRAKDHTYRFGNNRLPNSFEGDPAPALPEPSWEPADPRPLPRGYLEPEPAGSMGELVAEPLADLVPPMLSCGSPSRLSL